MNEDFIVTVQHVIVTHRKDSLNSAFDSFVGFQKVSGGGPKLSCKLAHCFYQHWLLHFDFCQFYLIHSSAAEKKGKIRLT